MDLTIKNNQLVIDALLNTDDYSQLLIPIGLYLVKVVEVDTKKTTIFIMTSSGKVAMDADSNPSTTTEAIWEKYSLNLYNDFTSYQGQLMYQALFEICQRCYEKNFNN